MPPGKMNTDVGFEILLASPPEFERLVAEIYYDGACIAIIALEDLNGEFEFLTPEAGAALPDITRRVPLPGLLETIERACKALKEQRE